MVLVWCVVAVSAQGLPRRTLGTRFPGQSAAVTPKQKQNVMTTNGVEWTYRVVDDAVILEGIVSERREKIRGKGLAVDRSISASIPKNTSGDLTIPDTIAGKSVRCIGCNAFYYCDKLTSVAIPPSVTTIDALAFSGCNRLTSVKMLREWPNSPRNDIIFKGGMRPCKNLKSIHVPANCKSWAGMTEWQGIPLVFDAESE